MDVLSRQPDEILHNILSFIELDDLRGVSHLCKRFRVFVRDSDLLWKQHIFRACVSRFYEHVLGGCRNENYASSLTRNDIHVFGKARNGPIPQHHPDTSLHSLI